MIHQISKNKYDYHTSEWWCGRKAIVLKNYKNISGDTIDRDSLVTINSKMELKKPGYQIHNHTFYVTDTKGVSVGGILCEDLVLLSSIVDLLSVCNN